MRIKSFGNTTVSGIDFAAGERQASLRAMHRTKLRPAAAASSGWGNDVAGTDKRSVHAWLNGKGDLRATWWNLYSRIYTAVVPGADLERAMYSYHRVHHAVTLWLAVLYRVGWKDERRHQEAWAAGCRPLRRSKWCAWPALMCEAFRKLQGRVAPSVWP